MAIPSRVILWLAAALLALLGLVFGLPWALYGLGLRSIAALPEPPATLRPAGELREVWQRAGIPGEPVGAVLDPVSYLASASVQARPPAITAFAWRVASDHLAREPGSGRGPLQQHLAGAALTIWLTRHWTAEALLSRVVELEAAGRSAVPTGR